MKTTFPVILGSLMAFAPAWTPMVAQENHSGDDASVTYEAPEATTVVYDAPVTYYEPVMYQASVVYNAPVYYVSAPAANNETMPLKPTAGVSTVFVIGARGGSYGYGHEGSCAGTVIPFGQRGGWFGGRW